MCVPGVYTSYRDPAHYEVHNMQHLCITNAAFDKGACKLHGVTNIRPVADRVSSRPEDFEIVLRITETPIVFADENGYKVIFQQNKNLCQTINQCIPYKLI